MSVCVSELGDRVSERELGGGRERVREGVRERVRERE